MRGSFIAFSALFFIALSALFLRLSDSLRMKKRQGCMPWRVAPQVRLELTTLRLTAECSAIELLRIIRGLWRDSFGCPAVCCQLPALYAWLWRTPRLRTSLLARAPPWLLPRLRGSPRPASARCPVLPYVLGAGKTFVPPAPLGSRQLPTLPSRSQLSTISVWRLNFCVRYGYRWCPPAIVTGNFPSGRSPSLLVRFASHSSLSLRVLSAWLAPPPRTFKTAQVRVDQQTFTLLRLSLAFPRAPSASAAFTLALARSSSSDQALDRLVSPSSTPHSASTDDLSTSSSLRGLTCLKQWQSSSSGGLHA